MRLLLLLICCVLVVTVVGYAATVEAVNLWVMLALAFLTCASGYVAGDLQ